MSLGPCGLEWGGQGRDLAVSSLGREVSTEDPGRGPRSSPREGSTREGET